MVGAATCKEAPNGDNTVERLCDGGANLVKWKLGAWLECGSAGRWLPKSSAIVHAEWVAGGGIAVAVLLLLVLTEACSRYAVNAL